LAEPQARRDLLADSRLTYPAAQALPGQLVTRLPGYRHRGRGIRNEGRTGGWGETPPCRIGVPGELTGWRMLAPAAPPWLPCLADRSGVASKKEVALVYPRVNEINIPAAPDLGGASRAVNRGTIWQHLSVSGSRFPSPVHRTPAFPTRARKLTGSPASCAPSRHGAQARHYRAVTAARHHHRCRPPSAALLQQHPNQRPAGHLQRTVECPRQPHPGGRQSRRPVHSAPGHHCHAPPVRQRATPHCPRL
jgi:hypothetical protein